MEEVVEEAAFKFKSLSEDLLTRCFLTGRSSSSSLDMSESLVGALDDFLGEEEVPLAMLLLTNAISAILWTINSLSSFIGMPLLLLH